MARNERRAVEEFAEYLWHSNTKYDTSEAWRSASRQAHGAFMFRAFMGGAAARQSQAMLDDIADLCDARAELAHAAEICARIAREVAA